MRKIILMISLLSLNATAQSWTNQVTNKDLQWKSGGIVNTPAGYNLDLLKGVVKGDRYLLRLQKDKKTGSVRGVNEAYRKPGAFEADGKTKSVDTFEVKRTVYDADGKISAMTECSGSRTLTSGWGMMMAMLSLSPSHGNKRDINCRTATPKMCETLRRELKEMGNHNVKQYAEACQKYSKDMSGVFSRVMQGMPDGMLKQEKAEAEQFYSEASGGTAFDYSSVNLSMVLSEMTADDRIKNLNTGMIMFNELLEIEKTCPREDKSPSGKSGRGNVGSGTTGTG